jgi:hypothetical protein
MEQIRRFAAIQPRDEKIIGGNQKAHKQNKPDTQTQSQYRTVDVTCLDHERAQCDRDGDLKKNQYACDAGYHEMPCTDKFDMP